MGHDSVLAVLSNLKAGTDNAAKPRIDLDFEGKMDSSTFHIGRTKVYYKEACENGTCTVTFTAPFLDQNGNPDKFENPLDVPDTLIDKLGLDPEFPGAEPYEYRTFSWQETYPDPRINPKKP